MGRLKQGKITQELQGTEKEIGLLEIVRAKIDNYYFICCRPEAHISFDNLAISQLSPERLFTNPEDFDKIVSLTNAEEKAKQDIYDINYSEDPSLREKVPELRRQEIDY